MMDVVKRSDTAAAVLERFIEAEVAYFAGRIGTFPAEEFLWPDFVLHEPESMPYGGAWHGHDGFRRFLEVMTRTWSTMGPKEPPELVEQGGIVVVLATLHARARATGELVESPVSQVVRVREGRLAEARMFYWDTEAINKAFGHDRT
ncbi:nuclear transport factor 2 family protein [Amycolatopsis sp. NPDC059021]|uniref:nuclear transport factor 2 family protein n=1 Tax=Amycolatopsis sp. NPDC059021 TaxID=3346704 RepID=UPI00366FE720